MQRGIVNEKSVSIQISFDQPLLKIEGESNGVRLVGKFLVVPADSDASEGALDQFDVSIMIPHDFPRSEPKVFETSKRIPRVADRHCNPCGSCCICVWEEWLTNSNDLSVRGFLEGPVRNFFLSQIYYETHKIWRFGERSHGNDGIIEACADMLGVERNRQTILRHLRVLAGDWPKGHWLCPCGSMRTIRNCHQDVLFKLHNKIKPPIARALFNKLCEKKSLRYR